MQMESVIIRGSADKVRWGCGYYFRLFIGRPSLKVNIDINTHSILHTL